MSSNIYNEIKLLTENYAEDVSHKLDVLENEYKEDVENIDEIVRRFLWKIDRTIFRNQNADDEEDSMVSSEDEEPKIEDNTSCVSSRHFIILGIATVAIIFRRLICTK